jgi:hypothetical protein
MSRACSTQKRAYEALGGKHERKRPLGNLDINGRIILNLS